MGLLIDGHWSDDDNIRSEEGKFIRPEKKFKKIEHLRRQIEIDIKKAK